MSKKHFIALADVIKKFNAASDSEGVTSHTPFTVRQIDELATFLNQQNPNFNRAHWLGYIAGTNGANGGAVKN